MKPQGQRYGMGLLQRAGQFLLHRLPVPQAGLQVRCVVVSPGPALPAAQQALAFLHPRIGGAAQGRAQGCPLGEQRVGVRGAAVEHPVGALRHAAEQKVLHERLLHVHPILAPARSLRLLHVRMADMSLRRNSLPALARHRVAFHATRPSRRYSMSAFCTCIRFWLRPAACGCFTSAWRT